MNVLILGATGTLGSAARQELLNQTDANLTLFSRSADRLTVDPEREKAISGDLTNGQELDAVMEGQDVVFAALSGNLKRYAQSIVESMDRNHVQRLIFISSMGIYDEIPASVGSRGNLKYNSVLRPYREAADVIEASDLNYTVIRPGWFTGGPVNYEVTHKGEPFGGHDVSINSIADLVLKLVNDNQLYSKESVGINTPA
ncbi:NAD(P)H-binding protein [Limosilactobacillus gastricus]|uniref:NAD(P)H-binding protein n=1 Tax=Limosilactobacillus gastricus TaxID=227942 RepID=UPI0026F10093|nr:NAD(P)H-binding protein [Limosilactobacillus gastricus]